MAGSSVIVRAPSSPPYVSAVWAVWAVWITDSSGSSGSSGSDASGWSALWLAEAPAFSSSLSSAALSFPPQAASVVSSQRGCQQKGEFLFHTSPPICEKIKIDIFIVLFFIYSVNVLRGVARLLFSIDTPGGLVYNHNSK